MPFLITPNVWNDKMGEIFIIFSIFFFFFFVYLLSNKLNLRTTPGFVLLVNIFVLASPILPANWLLPFVSSCTVYPSPLTLCPVQALGISHRDSIQS